MVEITTLTLLIIGCASTSVFVDTLPTGSTLYMKSGDTEEYETVGVAPIEMQSSELRSKFNSDGPFTLMAKLDNYNSATTYITEIPANSDLRITLSLKPDMDAEKTLKLNRTLDLLFESQRLVKVGRYEDALKQLDQIQLEYPYLSAPFEMQGGIFYIQKDFSKAVDAYHRAARLNPQNPELISMKQFLEKMRNEKEGAKDENE